VTGVVAHWRLPSPIAVADALETRRVLRVPLRVLADPANRLVHENDAGWRGPAFRVEDSIVWGYTGEIVAALLRFYGDCPDGAPRR
jgi:hypothetical protein